MITWRVALSNPHVFALSEVCFIFLFTHYANVWWHIWLRTQTLDIVWHFTIICFNRVQEGGFIASKVGSHGNEKVMFRGCSVAGTKKVVSYCLVIWAYSAHICHADTAYYETALYYHYRWRESHSPSIASLITTPTINTMAVLGCLTQFFSRWLHYIR